MNKNRLFILIAVISVLAMLIPVAAVPVSAQASVPHFTPAPGAGGFYWNIAGAIEQFTVTGLTTQTVTTFSVADQAPGTGAVIVATSPASTNPLPATTANLTTPGGNGSWVKVQATTIGQANVIANLNDGTQIIVLKKWGEINESIISNPQDVVVTWSEANKTFSGNATINDIVIGTFFAKNESTGQFTIPEEARANGAILHWYLLQDTPANMAAVAAVTGPSRNLASIPLVLATGETISSGIKFDPAGVTFTAATSAIAGLPKATFASFGPQGVLPVVSTTTTTAPMGSDGNNQVTITTTGEEPVLVVVIPEYPNLGSATQFPTVVEWTKVNFWTSEMEKVPQVRWAGEKIVLEKYFGPQYAGLLVRFSLENQSPGALEGIQGTQLGNLNNSAQTVWDIVSTGTDAGWARCILVSEAPGEVDVDLALYNQVASNTLIIRGFDPTVDPGGIINQHGFVVFYLKLESITLSNVVGKRAEHNNGLFNPPNPWDVTKDVTSATLNVSADDLLRARVRGWFMGDNMSNRPETVLDADPTHPGQFLYTLPKGRWVLPDDWPVLAGPNWREMRLHWDIMDNPSDTVGSRDGTLTTNADGMLTQIPPETTNLGKGNYTRPYTSPAGTLIAAAPVIGPFRPGIEVATSPRYDTAIGGSPSYVFDNTHTVLIGAYDPNINVAMASTYDDALGAAFRVKSVVPNGLLEWWDAPMPPAKITFEILNASVTNDAGKAIGAAGFFKDAFKTDIYYVSASGTKVYTNPFYWEYIPAHRFIPAFVNNGGYDWDSWNTAYGPYQFWKIINRPPNDLLPGFTRSNVIRDNANFPSKVQVYSDNHGEAMVYLNGNYNLNPDLLTFKGVEPALGSTVGSTSVIAIADYPYFRKHAQIISSPVVKTWTWGGQVLGPTNSPSRMILAVGDYHPVSTTDGTSNDLMVFVWATDRDERQAGVIGTQVDWTIGPATSGVKILDLNVPGDGTNGVSNFNSTMKSIGLEHGFLKGTGGMITGSGDGTQGRSFMRVPTAAEKDLFNKFWGPTGTNPLLDAEGQPLDPNDFVVAAVDLVDVTMQQTVTVTELLTSPDFGTLLYFTNVNFVQSYPLDDNILPGDANLDGKVNMADVTAIERIILGLAPATVQADANGNDKIDMGDVVKAERIIMGLH